VYVQAGPVLGAAERLIEGGCEILHHAGRFPVVRGTTCGEGRDVQLRLDRAELEDLPLARRCSETTSLKVAILAAILLVPIVDFIEGSCGLIEGGLSGERLQRATRASLKYNYRDGQDRYTNSLKENRLH